MNLEAERCRVNVERLEVELQNLQGKLHRRTQTRDTVEENSRMSNGKTENMDSAEREDDKSEEGV